VIGAGDYIGSEIAKKFAAEGFTVVAGRRNGEKLAPLIDEVKSAGGTIYGHSLDARKEDEIISFINEAERHAPIEVCIFNIGANVNFPSLTRRNAFSERFGRWLVTRAFLPAARPPA